MTFPNEQDLTTYLVFTYIHQSKIMNANEMRFNTDKIIFIVCGKFLPKKCNIIWNSRRMFSPSFSINVRSTKPHFLSRWSRQWNSSGYSGKKTREKDQFLRTLIFIHRKNQFCFRSIDQKWMISEINLIRISKTDNNMQTFNSYLNLLYNNKRDW